jgi:soluble lytic murein transglycosylase-like protein
MAVKTKRASASPEKPRWQTLLIRHLPGWLMLGIAMVILLPHLLVFGFSAARQVVSAIPAAISNLFAHRGASGILSQVFTPEVEHWAADIKRWADAYNLDPNLLATVMQIESCGHPNISSSAGAQGLFQVMPFHFTDGQNQTDPDTNANAGAKFLQQCLVWANGDPGKALACYNGGPGVLKLSASAWSDQTRRYYVWGMGIYRDTLSNQSHSVTLDAWLAAGGGRLCQMARDTLGLEKG